MKQMNRHNRKIAEGMTQSKFWSLPVEKQKPLLNFGALSPEQKRLWHDAIRREIMNSNFIRRFIRDTLDVDD